MIRVYVAGPLSDHGNITDEEAIEANICKALAAADQLWAAGFVPFVPHAMTWRWEQITHRPVHEWMAYDLHWLNQCHALLRLPGKSRGSDIEEAHARMRGILVYEDIDLLISDREALEEAIFPPSPNAEVG